MVYARTHRGHVVCTLIPSNNRMVRSSNPLSVAVAAVRGFWMVGKTSRTKDFPARPALDNWGPGTALTLPQITGEGYVLVCVCVCVRARVCVFCGCQWPCVWLTLLWSLSVELRPCKEISKDEPILDQPLIAVESQS